MRTTLRLYFTRGYWSHVFSPLAALKAILSAIGVLWLTIELLTFFAPESADGLRRFWWLFLFGGAVWALWENRPLTSVRHKISGRDVWVSICVGDLFAFKGAYVIGSNRTFDTELSHTIISPNSVQGQFTSQYYDSVQHLDADLDRQLGGVDSERVPGEKPGKVLAYPIGTVVKLDARNQTAYLVAIAELNEHGTARGSLEHLQQALAQLWEFVSSKGTIECIVCPVLGSGYSRIAAPREVLVQEIVKSFVAACASAQFSEGLIVVIAPRDYAEHGLDIRDLGAYVKHLCRYHGAAPGSIRRVGIPVEAAADMGPNA